jgi:hypothetical protein
VKRFLAVLFCVILCCNLAEAADPLRGAMVRKAPLGGQAVDQIIPNNTFNPYALLTFNQVIYDTDGAFDPSDSSFVIPAGIHFARINVEAVLDAKSQRHSSDCYLAKVATKRRSE